MSSFEDIAQERQRITTRLVQLDEERAKLAAELAELDAAERVLSRLTRTQRPERPVPPPRQRASRSGAANGVPSLGDVTLRAVEALGSDVSAEEVRAYLEREFGMHVRPNHLGMALQRHRRSGRLEQHDRRWSMPGAGAGA